MDTRRKRIYFIIILSTITLYAYFSLSEPVLKGPSCFQISTLNFSNDGRYLAITGWNEGGIWDMKKKTFIKILPYRPHLFYRHIFLGTVSILPEDEKIIIGPRGGHCDLFSSTICRIEIRKFEGMEKSSIDAEVILNGMYYIIDRDDNIYFIKEKIGQVDIFRGINFYYKKSFEPYISVKYFKKVPVKSTLYPENRIILIWSDYAKRLEIWQYNDGKVVKRGAIEYSDDKV